MLRHDGAMESLPATTFLFDSHNVPVRIGASILHEPGTATLNPWPSTSTGFGAVSSPAPCDVGIPRIEFGVAVFAFTKSGHSTYLSLRSNDSTDKVFQSIEDGAPA